MKYCTKSYSDEWPLHAICPGKGRLIQGTGGLRKARIAARGKGKSGGARVIYLDLPRHRVIYLLWIYDKGEANDLTAAQKNELKAIAMAIKQEYRS